MIIYDTIVIGAGVAGLAACLNLLRGGLKVLLLEQETIGGQVAISPRIENIPSIKEISGEEYASLLFDQVADLGVDFELEEVTHIEKEDPYYKVVTNYGEHLTKTIIIASGVVHRHLGLPKEEEFIGKGISYCAVCDGAFYKGKDIVLIGDANSALQYAYSLSKIVNHVHICALFDHLFADKILIDRLPEYPNIDVRYNLEAQELLGDDHLTGVVFKDKDTGESVVYDTDGVFVAIGQIPSNERYANLVDLNHGYIVVDPSMATKSEGIYAAGDCTDKKYRQIVLAQNDGQVAAISIINYLNTKKF